MNYAKVININNILLYKWEYKPKADMCAWFKNTIFQVSMPWLQLEWIQIVRHSMLRNIIPVR